MAAFIPIAFAAFAKTKQSIAFPSTLISALLVVFFVATFYIYFKGTNERFYQSALNPAELQSKLVTWSKWHWVG